jgi:dTDP-4-amino-4,6-dideoxygalactose transaminase
MIPLADLQAQYQSIKAEIDGAMAGVVARAEFVLGPEVSAFEAEFAAFTGAAEAAAVSSGTSALHLALLAAGVGPGDEVVTVPFTFVATAAAIGYAGARAVFVDVDPATLTMDVSRLERAITARTRAIIPVHLYGQPADMDPILDLARRHRCVVIEDAAHAPGAAYKGRRVGSLGDLACFSFYPGKNLGAYGEAGLVTTGRPELAATIRLLRNWGQARKHEHTLKGFNYRMDALQAAVLRVKLRHLDAWNAGRRRIASRYDARFRACGVPTVETAPFATHVHHVYAVRSRSREALIGALTTAGVGTGIHYPVPIHLQPAYADLGYRAGAFPVSECAAAEVLSLPIYPELGVDRADWIADLVGSHRDG